MNTSAQFEEGGFYHVFNRSNNREPLFKKEANYSYFLKRYRDYLGEFVDTYAYALIKNHFHFCICVKNIKEINDFLSNLKEYELSTAMKKYLEGQNKEILVHDLISNEFRRLFISYSQAINKQENRSGNLFNRPFKRALIDAEHKFAYVLYYIHHNARKHGIVKSFIDFPYTSYHEIVSEQSNLIDYKYIFQWFGSKEEFLEFHNELHYESKFKDFVIED